LKICPLCKRTYPDIAKVCPQLHCPNCGSTNIKEKEDDSFFFFFLLSIVMVFSFLFGAMMMGVWAVLFPLSIALIAYALNLSFYYCNTCGAFFIGR
jgi:uncharacterized protein (DUF983 family)